MSQREVKKNDLDQECGGFYRWRWGKRFMIRSVLVVTEVGRRKMVLTRMWWLSQVLTRNVVVVTEGGRRKMVLTKSVVVAPCRGCHRGRKGMGLIGRGVVVTEI